MPSFVVPRARSVLSQAMFAACGAAVLAAQDAPPASAPPDTQAAPAFVTELLFGTEAERLVCFERFVNRDQTIQRRGDGWYAPAWNDAFPVTWQITLLDSERTVTLSAAPYRRPRQIVVIGTRPDSLGGGLETVQVVYRADGSVQAGSRAVTTRPADNGSRVRQGPLLDEDGVLAFTLARELAFRCERGLFEALPPNTLWGMIPPD